MSSRINLLNSILLFCCISLLTGCASNSNNSLSSSAKRNDESVLSDGLLRQILLGNIAFDDGNYALATQYLSSAAYSSKNPKLLIKAYQAAAKAKNNQEAIQLATELVARIPKDIDAHTLLATAYINNQQFDQGAKAISSMLSLGENHDVISAKFETIKTATSLENLHKSLQELSQDHHPAIKLIEVKVLHANKQLLAALIQSQSLIQNHPKFVDGVLYYTKILTDNDDHQKAITLLEDLTNRFDDIKDYKAQLATLHYQQGNYQKAANYYSELVVLEPANKNYLYALGVSRFMQHDYDGAKEIFLLLQPTGYRPNVIHYYLGHMYELTGEYQLAIESFLKISTGSYLEKAQLQVASILSKLHGPQKALDFIQNARSQYPQLSASLDIAEIETLEQLGQTQKAIQLAESLISESPFRFALMVKHVALLSKTNASHLPQVLEQYSELDLRRLTQNFVNGVAYELISAEKLELAIDWYGKLIARSPRSSELYYNRALLLSEQGDYQQSASDLEMVLNLVPNNFEAMNALGYLLADQNINLSQADYLIREAYRHMPNSAAITDSLGWLYYRQNNLEQAIHYLEKALALQFMGDIAAHLGEVYWMNNQPEKAKQIWNKGLAQFPDHELLIKTIKNFYPLLLIE